MEEYIEGLRYTLTRSSMNAITIGLQLKLHFESGDAAAEFADNFDIVANNYDATTRVIGRTVLIDFSSGEKMRLFKAQMYL